MPAAMSGSRPWCRAAERVGGAPEEQCPGDREAQGADQDGGAEEDPGEQEDGAPVGRFVEVDVLAALRLAASAAQDVAGEQDGDEEEQTADDEGDRAGADGAALGDVDAHGEGVGEDEQAEREQQDADAEFECSRSQERAVLSSCTASAPGCAAEPGVSVGSVVTAPAP